MKILPLILFAALAPSMRLPAQEQSSPPHGSGPIPEDGRMMLRDGDKFRPFRIETSELVVLGEDGIPAVVSTPGIQSMSALRTETMTREEITGRRALPTAFPEGLPRTEMYRHVVSDTVIVRLAEGVDPSLVAGEVGAIRCTLLIYSPDSFQLQFSDPWAALAAAEVLPQIDGVLDAWVELGRRLYPRMVPTDEYFSPLTSRLGAYTQQTLTTDVQARQNLNNVGNTRNIPTNVAYQWYLRNEPGAGITNRVRNYVADLSEDKVRAIGDKPFTEPVPDWAPYYVLDVVRSRLLFPVDLNVTSAWDLLPEPGDDVTFAIVDEGVDFGHVDLPSGSHRSTFSKNIGFGGDTTVGAPYGPTYHHGTSMTGIILAATNNNSRGMAGIAPHARFMSVRLLGGFPTDSQVAEALIAPAERKEGPNVLDPYDDQWQGQPQFDVSVNAYGYGDSGTDFADAPLLFDRALLYGARVGRSNKGAIYIFAGDTSGDTKGNNNYSDTTNSMYAIQVGSVSDVGRRIGASAPGASLHVVAPSGGDELAPQIEIGGALYPNRDQAMALQTVDNEHWTPSQRRRTQRVVTLQNGNEYTKDFMGTSASAAMVAGVVGLMLDANPDLGWRDVQEILMRSADIVNPLYGGWQMTALGVPMSHYYGAGLVNAERAVRMAQAWTNLPSRNLPSVNIRQIDHGGKRGIRAGTLISTMAEEPRDPLGSSLDLLIPDNANLSLSRPVGSPPAGFRVEHVEVEVDIDHSRRGDLEIILEAPPVGTQEDVIESHLYLPHRFDAQDGMRWRFMTLRHWGARYSSSRDWTLRIRDTTTESQGYPKPNNAEPGRLRGYAVTFYGAEGASPNEVPVVRNPSEMYAIAGRPLEGAVDATTSAKAPLLDYSFMVRSRVSGGIQDNPRETGINMTEPIDPAFPYISEKPEFSGVPIAGKWIVDIAASNVFGVGRKAVTLTVFGKFSYEDWQKVHFSGDEVDDIGKRRDDPDGDGIPNLIEFLTGGDPRAADAFDVPFTKEYDGVVHVVVPVDTNAEGATLRLQTSLDLETWEDVELTQVEDPEGPLVYRGAPHAGDDERRFYRAHAGGN